MKRLIFVILLVALLVGLAWWFRVWETEIGAAALRTLATSTSSVSAPTNIIGVPPPPAQKPEVGPPTIRFIRLQRTSGIDDAFAVALLEAYAGGQRWPAVDGVVAPGFADPVPAVLAHLCCGWEHLNDASPHTTAHTARSPHAYMELDLGAGGRSADRVRVLHAAPEQYRQRMNGVTLWVMDEDRIVVFHHTFTGLDEQAPRMVDFVLGDGAALLAGAPPETGQRVRYVRLAALSTSESPMRVHELSMWQGTHRWFAVAGTADGEGWSRLNGAGAAANVTATATATAPPYIELDLGTAGRVVDRVRAQTADSSGEPTTVLYVMDTERRILTMQMVHQTTDCVLGMGDPATALLSIPPEEIKRVRYLRLTRTIGDEEFVETALEGYLGPRSGKHLCPSSAAPRRTLLCRRGRRHTVGRTQRRGVPHDGPHEQGGCKLHGVGFWRGGQENEPRACGAPSRGHGTCQRRHIEGHGRFPWRGVRVCVPRHPRRFGRGGGCGHVRTRTVWVVGSALQKKVSTRLIQEKGNHTQHG